MKDFALSWPETIVLILLWCIFQIGSATEKNCLKSTAGSMNNSSFYSYNQTRPFLRVITNLQPAFIQLRQLKPKETEFTGKARYEGYLKDLIEKLSEVVGFEYTMDHITWSGNFTGVNPAIPQDYGGMLGKILRNEYDIALADMTITRNRMSVVHFSYPYYISGYSILAYRTETEDWKLQIWNFLNPFKIETWFYILLGCIAISLIRILHFYTIDNCLYNGNQEQSNQGFSFKQMFNLIYHILFGHDPEFRSLSGKLLCATWKVFRFILVSCYAANLAAFMTVNRLRHPINSVDDLVNQKTIRYGVNRNGAIMEFLEHSSQPVYQKMHQYFIQKNSKQEDDVKDLYGAVKKIRSCKGEYAFIAETVDIDYASIRQPCDLIRIGESFDFRGLGIAMSLNFSYEFKRAIDLGILELLETGWFNALEQKWWYNVNECEAKNAANPTEGLTVTKLGGVFLILCFGILVSVSIGIGEYFNKRRSKVRPSQKDIIQIIQNNIGLSKENLKTQISNKS